VVRAYFSESLANDAVGKFGAIAVLAEVAEVEMSQVGRHDLFGNRSGCVVGEVAVAAEDALFDTPRAASIFLQEFHVVVGLKDQHVGAPYSFDDKFGRVTEIGKETDVPGGGVDEEPDRVVGVVWNRECVHGYISDLHGAAGEEDAAFQAGLKLAFDGLLRQSIAVDGDS
jgi:hypothetical protein